MLIQYLKFITILLMGYFYINIGIKHFTEPEWFLQIMPPYLPYHIELVYISGFFEILLGILFKSFSISISEIIVPVGLFGFAKKIIFVWAVRAAQIFSIDAVRLFSLTSTGFAPVANADSLYIKKPCSV